MQCECLCFINLCFRCACTCVCMCVCVCARTCVCVSQCEMHFSPRVTVSKGHDKPTRWSAAAGRLVSSSGTWIRLPGFRSQPGRLSVEGLWPRYFPLCLSFLAVKGGGWVASVAGGGESELVWSRQSSAHAQGVCCPHGKEGPWARPGVPGGAG